MNYTKAQRKTLVKLFKRALNSLPATHIDRRNSSPYICDNITRASGWNGVSCWDDAHMACQLITERINHAFSIERWLKLQSEEIAAAVRYDVMSNQGRKLQEYRKEWLRKLIAEFEA